MAGNIATAPEPPTVPEPPRAGTHLARALDQAQAGDLREAALSFDRFLETGDETLAPERRDTAARLYLEVQLQLTEDERPARARAEANFKQNLAALSRRNPELAALLSGQPRPHLEVVALWRELRFCDRRTGKVALAAAQFPHSEIEQAKTALLFGGILSGSEVVRAAHGRPALPNGAVRTAYLVEPDLERAAMLLRLDDLSEEIEREALVIFAGADWRESMRRAFSTGFYPAPGILLGDDAVLRAAEQVLGAAVKTDSTVAAVVSRYESEEFKNRLRLIARGELHPRVLCLTNRFTTVLRYCAAEFERAFQSLGCESRCLIEASDGQRCGELATFKALEEFQPDLIFIVSHARNLLPKLPRSLPFLSYIQDQTHQLVTARELGSELGPYDILLVNARLFLPFFAERGVTPDRLFYEPAPADTGTFAPLPEDDPRAGAHRCDVAFVKHGFSSPPQALEEFLREQFSQPGAVSEHLAAFFRDLFEEMRRAPGKRHYQGEFRARLLSIIEGEGPFIARYADFFASAFDNRVNAALFRGHFLEALASSGLDLRIYGKGWDAYPALRPFLAGPVDHEKGLNLVYNFARINLNLLQNGTLHQRIMQGGLAGAFFLVAAHDPREDWTPLPAGLQDGRDLVLFDDSRDLLDKCRYYLGREEERRRIGASLREQVLAGHTTARVAARALGRFRERLRRA